MESTMTAEADSEFELDVRIVELDGCRGGVQPY